MKRIPVAALIPLLLFLLLAIGFAVAFTREDTERLPSVYIDLPAPALDLPPLEGYRAPNNELLAAPGLKLVNFWASWCPPCRAEHANLLALSKAGWVIHSVNKSDRAEAAQAFLDELGNPFTTIGFDPKGRAGIDWGVYGLPATFLIDGQGHVRFRYPGPVTQRIWEREFAPRVKALTQP